MKEATFNTTHPEIRDGEMFITNCGFGMSSDSYRKIGWRTKRKGEVAYTIRGKPIENTYPVFIQIKEYEESQRRSRRNFKAL